MTVARRGVLRRDGEQISGRAPGEGRHRRVTRPARQHLGAVVEAHQQHHAVGIADRHHLLFGMTGDDLDLRTIPVDGDESATDLAGLPVDNDHLEPRDASLRILLEMRQ